MTGDTHHGDAPGVRRRVVVVRPGAHSTVQDLGRPGWANLAVSRSGALDPAAHVRANRLVGNEDAAATIETTLDGVALRFEAAATVAVTGASARVRVDGTEKGWSLPLFVVAGETLDVGPATAGVRSYVAVAGGFDAEPVLGSRSSDQLSGLGPPPLTEGTVMRLGQATGRPAALDLAPYRLPGTHSTLVVHPGPRQDRLDAPALAALYAQRYEVSALSNRIGLRLEGEPLACRGDAALPSEGIVWGAVQLLPDGQLVVLLADHPTTGGYPVVAVVDAGSASSCAQARPGTHVRFRPVRRSSRRLS